MDLMEVDVLDPHPDVHELFSYYNTIYFGDALGACLVTWSSGHMTLCAGICHYIGGGSCEIRLSKPLLKSRSSVDLKNILLHEMIHAYVSVTYKNHDHGYHGSEFQQVMVEINSSLVSDYQRPPGGYNITIYHNFVEEVNSSRLHHWMCKACGDIIKKSINIEPSENDCIQGAKEQTCKHPSCCWHSHNRLCSGAYEKIHEPAGNQRKRSKRRRENHNTTAASSKGLDADLCRSNDVYSGVKSVGSQEELFSFLKDECENAFQDKHNSSLSVQDFQMVDDPNSSDDVEVLSAGESKIEPSRDPRIALEAGSHKKNKTATSQRKHYTAPKNIFDVIIKWKGWYAYEEDSDSSEPLIDKRIERRKRQGSDLIFQNCFSKGESVAGHNVSLNHHSKDLTDQRMNTEELSRWSYNSAPKSGPDMAGDPDWKEEVSVITDDEPTVCKVVIPRNVAESFGNTNYTKENKCSAGLSL